MEGVGLNRNVESITKVQALESLSNYIRKKVFELIKIANNGHLGGSSSSVELMTTLYFGGILKYNLLDPKHPERDRILVRGHLGPLRYNIFALLGWIEKDELNNYRHVNSRLEGHEQMTLPGVDITPSGSLGMLLSYGVGSAMVAKNENKDFKTYVFLGDGEEQEGNVSEAARSASHLELNNLVAIIDKNGKQLGFPTTYYEKNIDLAQIWSGYGWHVVNLGDGHSIPEILNALQVTHPTKPTVIIANTIKGKGVIDAEKSENGYHTVSSCPTNILNDALTDISNTTLTAEEIDKLLVNLYSSGNFLKNITHAGENKMEKLPVILPKIEIKNLPKYIGKLFQELISIYAARPNERLYIMTADVLRTEDAKELTNLPKSMHFLNVGIKEQHLLAMTHGIQATDIDATCILVTGEAFAYRSADQLNAIAQGGTSPVIIGINPGIGGAKNGWTHQSTGQKGMLNSMPGISVYEPRDTDDLKRVLELAINNKEGPTYISVHDMDVTQDILSDKDVSSYVAYSATNPAQLTIVTSGLTVGAAIEAAKDLDEEGISVRVIAVINMGDLNEQFVASIADGKPLLSVFNGNPEVLEGAIASSLFRYNKNRPSKISTHGFVQGKSGSIQDLTKYFGFDKEGIKKKAFQLILDQ